MGTSLKNSFLFGELNSRTLELVDANNRLQVWLINFLRVVSEWLVDPPLFSMKERISRANQSSSGIGGGDETGSGSSHFQESVLGQHEPWGIQNFWNTLCILIFNAMIIRTVTHPIECYHWYDRITRGDAFGYRTKGMAWSHIGVWQFAAIACWYVFIV